MHGKSGPPWFCSHLKGIGFPFIYFNFSLYWCDHAVKCSSILECYIVWTCLIGSLWTEAHFYLLKTALKRCNFIFFGAIPLLGESKFNFLFFRIGETKISYFLNFLWTWDITQLNIKISFKSTFKLFSKREMESLINKT